MFTGIIEKTGLIKQLAKNSDSMQIRVRTSFSDLKIGESVAVNGACLTVAELSDNEASFFVSAETLSKTNLGHLTVEQRVNLERAMMPTMRLSGHWVQGHVDGVGKIVSIRDEAGSHLMSVELSKNLARYCVSKGSIALNGVSLTVNSIDASKIDVTLIPHTWKETQFSESKVGDFVNVETDILAKYVEQLCRHYN